MRSRVSVGPPNRSDWAKTGPKKENSSRNQAAWSFALKAHEVGWGCSDHSSTAWLLLKSIFLNDHVSSNCNVSLQPPRQARKTSLRNEKTLLFQCYSQLDDKMITIAKTSFAKSICRPLLAKGLAVWFCRSQLASENLGPLIFSCSEDVFRVWPNAKNIIHWDTNPMPQIIFFGYEGPSLFSLAQ